jgi:ABC-2 type transport system permease protein
MTASIHPSATASGPSATVARRAGSTTFAGIRPLIRKEFAEWAHSRRVWVTVAVVTVFMVLTAANSAITALIIANLPAGADAPDAPVTMDPLENLLAAAGTQIFVMAAIFATMGLLVGERERGTLAWVASKPVGRGAIVGAKFTAAAVVAGLAAVVVPMLATLALVVVLYGVPAVVPVALVTAGMIALVAVFVAISLAASTVVTGQAAVAAVAFGAFFLPAVLGAVVPVDIAPFLPTSILGWAAGFAMGAPVGVVTPVAWAIWTVAIVAIAVWRLERAEL